MHFNVLNVAVTALALCSDVVFGAIPPSGIISNIQTLTAKSQALQAPAQSITIINGPLILIGQGPLPVSPLGCTQCD